MGFRNLSILVDLKKDDDKTRSCYSRPWQNEVNCERPKFGLAVSQRQRPLIRDILHRLSVLIVTVFRYDIVT